MSPNQGYKPTYNQLLSILNLQVPSIRGGILEEASRPSGCWSALRNTKLQWFLKSHTLETRLGERFLQLLCWYTMISLKDSWKLNRTCKNWWFGVDFCIHFLKQDNGKYCKCSIWVKVLGSVYKDRPLSTKNPKCVGTLGSLEPGGCFFEGNNPNPKSTLVWFYTDWSSRTASSAASPFCFSITCNPSASSGNVGYLKWIPPCLSTTVDDCARHLQSGISPAMF